MFLQWQSLLGLLTSAQNLTLRGRLNIWLLHMFLLPYIALDNPRLMLPLPDNLGPHLQWWQNPMNVLGSHNSWGDHLNDQVTLGLWLFEERSSHISVLELKAMINKVCHWRQILCQANLMVITDKITVAAYIIHLGSTHSSTLLQMTIQVFS